MILKQIIPMSKDSKWKDFLLKSGLPLEYEIKEYLENNGFITNFEYTYLRENQENQITEFSYDIDATYAYPPFFFELMIECKYRHNSTKWLFLPEDYEGVDETNFTSFLHFNDHFNKNGRYPNSEYPFKFADLCSKGIEITTEGQNPKTIDQAMAQLSYAMAEKIISGMHHQTDEILSKSFNGTIFFPIPIIITTSELYRLNENVSIEEIRGCNDITEIATKTNKLIIKNSTGVNLERFNYTKFKSFEEEVGKNILEQKLNTFNEDLDFVWSVISKNYSPQCIVVLHYSKENNGLEELVKYIKRFVNPDKITIKELAKIKKNKEERMQKFLERMNTNTKSIKPN